MAGLGGKIIIGINYRPCIVHIPAVTRDRRQDLNVYREVVEPEKDVRGLFHCWSHRSEVMPKEYSTRFDELRQNHRNERE